MVAEQRHAADVAVAAHLLDRQARAKNRPAARRDGRGWGVPSGDPPARRYRQDRAARHLATRRPLAPQREAGACRVGHRSWCAGLGARTQSGTQSAAHRSRGRRSGLGRGFCRFRLGRGFHFLGLGIVGRCRSRLVVVVLGGVACGRILLGYRRRFVGQCVYAQEQRQAQCNFKKVTNLHAQILLKFTTFDFLFELIDLQLQERDAVGPFAPLPLDQLQFIGQ